MLSGSAQSGTVQAASFRSRRQATCFFEADPPPRLGSRVLAELVGTALLMLAVVGAGLTAQRLSPEQALLAHLAVAATIAGALVGLICAFGVVLGGHFNPLITGLQWASGERRLDCAAAYVVAQVVGAFAGSGLAGLIFGSVPPASSGPAPDLGAIAGEAGATAGLLIVVLGCARSDRADTGPFAVGAWLFAAVLVTPSGSYANPAVALASLISSGPAHLAATTAWRYVAAEIAGSLVALAVILGAYPRTANVQRLGAD